jgi:hypothetical protein
MNMVKVKVVYWRSTTQLEGTATTYAGARRVASKNQNAYPPRFYDKKTGEQLHDDGQGLVYESSMESDTRRYAV